MFTLSFGIHLAILLLILEGHFLHEFHPDQAPVTYVDMATLPVASPQSGQPSPAVEAAPKSHVEETAPKPPAVKAPKAPAVKSAPRLPAPKAEMALPATKPRALASRKPSAAGPKVAAPVAQKPAADEEERAFEQRMAKLAQQADERRQNEVLARLKSKVGRTGMPGGKGIQAGSDYASYVQSRLRDAFVQVVASQSRSPQVIVTLAIGQDGRIADYRVEKSSGDSLFEDAVRRAVTLAGHSLKPPPNGAQFERMFRFKPEGVGIR